MPYRHAHWYLLVLFPLTGLAFWKFYFSRIASVPVAFHVHAITGTLWILLLVAQSWTIQHGRRDFHRQIGIASFALFPFFLAGGASVSVLMAEQFASRASAFDLRYDPRLALTDMVAVAGFAYCYWQALRRRREVHWHSRYMLSTVLFLLPPIVARLRHLVPPLDITGPQDLWKFGLDQQIAHLVAAGVAFFLAWRMPRYGRPFVETGTLIVLGAILFQTVGGLAWWQEIFALAASVPSIALAFAAGLAGIIIAYAGWVAGKRPRPRVGLVPA